MKRLLIYSTICCLSLSIWSVCGNRNQDKMEGRIQFAKMDTGIGSINGDYPFIVVPNDIDIGSLNSNYCNNKDESFNTYDNGVNRQANIWGS